MSNSPQVARWGLVAAGVLLGICLAVLVTFSPPAIPMLASAEPVDIPKPPESVSVQRLLSGTLQDVNGNDFDLSTLRGCTSVLYFASVENADAITNGRKLNELAASYPTGSGVQIVSVTEDTAPGKPYDRLAVRVHSKIIDASFPILLDPKASFSRNLHINRPGEAVVINPSGEVVYRGPLESVSESGKPRRLVWDAVKRSVESTVGPAVLARQQQQS